MYECLGISWLGMCSYDPSNPPVYFSLGDAVAAIAVTLALQSFMKPVYRLRLATRYLNLTRLYALIFVGVGLTVVAATVPSLPFLGSAIWRYSILWEVLATLFFVAAYGAVAITIVRPIRVREKQVERFTNAVANMLTEASEDDHVDIVPDIGSSLPTLVKLASFVEYRGREFSAFEMFSHRAKIRQASYAHSLLRILSDPLFCRSLVKRAPWSVAKMMHDLSHERIHCRNAEPFVQQLAHQAILLDDGILAREIGYLGFGEAPLLSAALFSDDFIVERYNPLGQYFHSDQITPAVVKRYNAAALRCFLTMIKDGYAVRHQVSYDIRSFYEGASLRAAILNDKGDIEHEFLFEMQSAVKNMIDLANKMTAAVSDEEYERMFAADADADERRWRDPLEPLVDIVFEIVSRISNSFDGPDDRFWMLARESIDNAFPPYGAEPDGLTPFQQRLMIRIIDKLNDNMQGFYPSICRVLLATVGPFEKKTGQPNATAFNILRNAMYSKLKEFRNLPEEKREKYLPGNVSYNSDQNALIHTYRSGTQVVTQLAELEIEEPDLLSPELRRPLTEEEREQARRDI